MSLRLYFAPLPRRVHPNPASVLCVALLASTAFAAGQTTINVTSVIHDDNVNNPSQVSVALLMRSDDYNNSACTNEDTTCATYETAGKCPSNCLTSVIQTSVGSWQLLLANQSVRKIRLTALSGSGTGTGPVDFTGSYSASVEVYARCWADVNETTGISLLQMTPGTTPYSYCALGMDFSNGNTKYKLEMGQTALDNGTTGTAAVSCTARSGATCTSWTIVPNTSGAIANLYEYTHNGSLSLLGQYTNRYRIDVTTTNP